MQNVISATVLLILLRNNAFPLEFRSREETKLSLMHNLNSIPPLITWKKQTHHGFLRSGLDRSGLELLCLSNFSSYGLLLASKM